jgi:adenine-specific DNA-methyltransferase
MRNFVLAKSKIESLVDFGSYMVFDTASIQTMIMTFKKEILEYYSFDYRKIQADKPVYENAIQLLNKTENENCIYLEQNIIPKKALNQLLTFTNSVNDLILNKLIEKKNFSLDEKNEIAQGIVPNPDVLSKKSYSNYYADNLNYKVGEPVFILPKNHLKNLNQTEISFLKPLYEPTDLERYFVSKSFSKEIIYLTKKNEVKDLDGIISHLEKFKDVLNERRETLSGQIKFYHIHWARDEKFFKKTAKILIPRKTLKPVFSYTEQETYVMMSCNVIISNRINQKYLTGLLNSKLIEFWLRNKGKMQGNNFQLDKEPLLNIPIFSPTEIKQKEVQNLVDQILFLKKENPKADTSDLENEIDELVYQLYELTPEEIEVVRGG